VAIYSLIGPNKCLLNLAIKLSNSRSFGVGAWAAAQACRAEAPPLTIIKQYNKFISFYTSQETFKVADRNTKL
jgi:hypothetical protein